MVNKTGNIRHNVIIETLHPIGKEWKKINNLNSSYESNHAFLAL